MADGKVTIETVLDSKDFNKALNQLGSKTKSGLGLATKAIAATATAVGGLAVAAVRSGIKFESAFAGVKKTVDATDAQLAQFRQGIRDMSKEMPSSAEAIAGVAEAAGQLGIKNENLLSFTKTMTMLGDATNMSSDEAATSLARLANITGMSQSDFDKLGSTVVALGNNLATTESEIVAMSMRIAGAGHQVGMTEAQIMSFSGALSSVGIEAEAGGTAFSTLISKMSLAAQTGGEQLEQFAKVAGMSADEFKASFEKDAAGAIITFIKGLDKINKNGGSAIKTLDDMGLSDIRMRDALLRAAGASDTFSEALAIGNRAWDENKALTNEAKERYKTLESRIGIFKNTINDIGISIYDSVNTPLGDMVTAATDAANGLSKAFEKDGIQGLAKGIGSVLADAATAAAKYAPDLITAGAQTVKAFAKGLYDNRKEIVSAAGDMAMALASGIADMLPKSLGNTIKNITKVTLSAVKPVLKLADVFLKVAAAGSSVAPVLLGVVGALKSYSVVGPIVKTLIAMHKGQMFVAGSAKALSAAQAINTAVTKANGVITTFAAAKAKALAAAEARNAIATAGGTTATIANTVAVQAQGVAAGVAAVATKGLGAAMAFMGGPAGIAVAAIGALVGVVAMLGTESALSADKQVKAGDKILNSIKKQRDSYNETVTAAKKKMQSEVQQMDTAAALKQELDNLVDANGKVKAGYEARAQFIAGQLSDATGIEIKLIDGVIDGYGNIGTAIDNYIEKKRAEAILKANEEAWLASQKQLKNEIKNYQELSEKIDYYHQKYEENVRKNTTLALEYKHKEEEAIEARKKSSQIIKECGEQDKEYQQMYADFMAGNYDAINSYVAGHASRMAEIENMKRSELEKTKVKTESDLKFLQQLYEETGNAEVKKALDAKQKELKLVDEKLSGMASKTKSGGDKVAAESRNASSKALSAAKHNKHKWHGLGSSMMGGVISGIRNKARELADAAVNAVSKAYKKAKHYIKSNSPSKKFRDGIGKPISEGIAVGINEEADQVSDSAVMALKNAYNATKDLTGFDRALNSINAPSIANQFKAAAEMQMATIPSSVSTANKALYPGVRFGRENQSVGRGETTVLQTININQPVKTPYETGKALRKEAIKFGLAGA